MAANPNILYYGMKNQLPVPAHLQAGPLTLDFQQGDLRYIRYGHNEVVRCIYVAVRDQHWRTADAEISNLLIDREPDGFLISFDMRNRLEEVDFAWHGSITGATNGCLTYCMDGIAHRSFLRNRIGICVLHPIRECAGKVCVVEHSDGTVEEGIFPDVIVPWQPFIDIRACSYEIEQAVRTTIRFSGDVFEMEDQRNWSDASYKTYSTPLSQSLPVRVDAGTRISQTVTLEVDHHATNARHHVYTTYETTGWRGIMAAQESTDSPDGCGVPAGAVFPVYHVFDSVGEFAGGQAIRCASSDSLSIDAMALTANDALRILVANYTQDEHTVLLERVGVGAELTMA